ncbi:MAG: tRNA (adenosine(37)-N6)-threonylcarbamoyltransferase complex transferase subunit TsaD [Bacillota bacterium]|jgi:N6-L-threonylcarbamoyladenine synthase
MEKDINILAIESSCDETAAAVVANGRRICSNIISSQIAVHQPYGGVVPEIASRCHLQAIVPVVSAAMEEAGLSFTDLDAVAVSSGPGLVGALLVGVSYAKALAQALSKPLISVNHWQGHICAVFLQHDITYPFVALVASGSHSGIVEVRAAGVYRLLGASRDDAAGEAFDKIARALGLGYPGGPQIEKAALTGDKDYYQFPRAYLEKDSYDFSFSGLKSAVMNYINQRAMKNDPLRPDEIPHLAAAAQEAITSVLAEKTLATAKELGFNKIVLAGGVAANQRLRELFDEQKSPDMQIFYPSPLYCTDNAAMIGVAAYDKYLTCDFASLDLNADPRQNIYLNN